LVRTEMPINPCATGGFRPHLTRRCKGAFGPLQRVEALLYAPPFANHVRLFLGSSAVEHSTVNRMVAGSNPARGANEFNHLLRSSKHLENLRVCKRVATFPPLRIEPQERVYIKGVARAMARHDSEKLAGEPGICGLHVLPVDRRHRTGESRCLKVAAN
jgi:hypothetical protein